MTATYHGQCFCGAVQIEVTGDPVSMGYCHCRSCRSWSAAPVNAFTLWRPNSVRIARGAEHLATFSATGATHRQFCRICGGHIMSAHPAHDLVDVYAATIPALAFSPQVHTCYAEAVLAMHDGLTKLRDFPETFGGSGVVIQEKLCQFR
jgi:hypothetical protein